MLAYERIGSGPPLVLVHGISHRRQAWYPVLDRLVDHREVILVDLPGHGESPPLEPDPGGDIVATLEKPLLELLERLQLDRPHIAGNSLGGRVALEAASRGWVRSATCLSPAGFWVTDRGFLYTRTMFRAWVRLGKIVNPLAPRMSRSGIGRTMMYLPFLGKPWRLDPDLALGDFRAFRAAEPAIRWILPRAFPFHQPIPPNLPVTIAWGTRDLTLPPYQARVAQRQLPNARHITLPGCGHVPMNDAPDLVAKILLEGSNSTIAGAA
ncbi:hydrolase [Longimycelium tulufanense]|uniref:Hydrolase n=1 Tax=Longimycelium tulufanense TaxID=907463 RepID=A0A8J3CDZ5_9PSEU|nr:alpha/beta hydrolase [Longimycelium tulufanense]GGM80310.1 hydrolase [Longimycelium tulufanense]